MKSPSKSARTAKTPGTPRKMRTKASAQKPVQHSSGAPVEGLARATSHNASAERVTVRVYRQGLGDCILVRVKRAGHDDFKLMIDCGVVLGTPDAGRIMTRVMDNLVGDTQEKVDVLAITHEHWDHLSGFMQAPDSFAKLGVGAVWVAWTEDPKDDLANQLRTELGAAKQKLVACANALHAVGDGATAEMMEDMALTPPRPARARKRPSTR
jgi:glyoxylase-like metal-dependent hydrolase (beta-lactamase superfamily II)